MGLIDTRDQAAAALAQPGCGTRTWLASVASPASTPATSRPTTRTSSSAADRVATRRRSATPRSPTRSTAASLTDSNVQPLWISRHFDSIYSVAITEVAVYVGGHFGFIESPTSDDPWPGLDNVGYGTGQGLAGYGLGDQVVRRDHIAALNPVDGKALEWNPTGGSNSFEGDKAMEATSRGLFIGGDGHVQGRSAHRTGRVLRLQHGDVPAGAARHHDHDPHRGPGRRRTTCRSTSPGRPGSPPAPSAGSRCRSRTATAASTSRTTAPPSPPSAPPPTPSTRPCRARGTTRSWSIPATITTNRNLLVSAQAFTAATGGTGDSTRATQEVRVVQHRRPDAHDHHQRAERRILASTTFTMTGTANDDKGVNSLTYWFRDAQNRYLQDDGTVERDLQHLPRDAGRHRRDRRPPGPTR